MKTKKQRRISRSFLQWLFVVVAIAFLSTTLFLWLFQTDMAKESANQLLLLNIKDVKADIRDASDGSLLSLAHEVKDDILKSGITDYTSISFTIFLKERADHYGLTEINYINDEGIIVSTTHPAFLDYDMTSGNQSSEFMVLLEGETEYVQSLRPTSYDDSIFRKYGGVSFEEGGFIQVGYDTARSHASTAKSVIGATRNRHVGKDGSVIIASTDNWKIVSDRNGNEGQKLDSIGISIDKNVTKPNQPFEANVYGEPSFCMYHETEGYTIIAVIPQSEAALSRDIAVAVTTVIQIIVFAVLFILIYSLVHKLVVNNIHKVNLSLAEITGGNLETVVNVRSHKEFEELSNDINQTVDTLKKYIADAAARIDTELAFASAIQHSALPSVFPPYPNRNEFDIYAAMHTAKEVGGDFYDFYFVDDDNFAFLIADVSGKGIPAAMFMMQSKTVLKSLAESGMSVDQVFTLANEKLCDGNDAGMFVTAWMGILNVKTGKLVFANAGHNPPLVRHADQSYEYLKSRAGFVLAGMEGVRYRKNELQLEPGDAIYLYTDGVTEATNLCEELYGEDRLHEILEKNKKESMQTICDEIKKDVDLFVGEAPQFDDITMLALKYNQTEVDE